MVRPLRVLTVTPFYPSAEDPSQGGFVADPLIVTESLGISNHVIAAQPFYRPRQRYEPNAAIPGSWNRYFSVPGNAGLPTSGAFLSSALSPHLRALHMQKPFDLIHAHATLPCGHAAERLGRELSIPYIVSVHGLDAFAVRQGGRFLGKWCRQESERVFRHARSVVCISRKIRDQISQCAPGKTIAIYNGVDPRLFSPGTETFPLTILSVGNLIPVKGHDLLLRAFADAVAASPGCRLEIIGDGPERERLERTAGKLGIARRVLFRGRQSRNEVAQAMKRCAIFALPSHYEGLGCVYLEAMSSGKPAIGCWGQGIEEIIESGKNGILVFPESQADLSEALRDLLLNRDLRHRLGTAARDAIVQHHTLECQARQLAQLYRECAQ